MELDNRVKQLIDYRMKKCEEQYNIKVLSWFLRGSIQIGIYRKNSDLDLVFLYKNLEKQKCAGIHDIMGWGFDFWGWDIEDAVKDLNKNILFYHEYKKTNIMYLSQEHARGTLDCLHGLYLKLGNDLVGGNNNFNLQFDELLQELLEPAILAEYALLGMKNIVHTVEIIGKLSSNEYLYSIWRVLLAGYIMDGGLPGDNRIDKLIEVCGDRNLQEQVDGLREIYKGALTKSSQRFEIDYLNNYIIQNYVAMKQKIDKQEVKVNNIDKCLGKVESILQI